MSSYCCLRALTYRVAASQLHHLHHCGREGCTVRGSLHALLLLTDDSHHRPSPLDVQFVDFDGVRFRLTTPDRKVPTALVLSMNIRCWEELVRYGVDAILKREYGSMLRADPESGYNVTLDVNLEQIPADGGMHAQSYSLLCLLTPIRGTRGLHQGSRLAETECASGTV